MKRAQVVTAWTVLEGPTGPENHPAVAVVYRVGFGDVTGQDDQTIQPDPNAYTIEVVCDEATLAQMDADGVPILWAEDV